MSFTVITGITIANLSKSVFVHSCDQLPAVGRPLSKPVQTLLQDTKGEQEKKMALSVNTEL